MQKDTDQTLKVFAAIGFLALIPTMMMYRGLIFTVLWGWFMVPMFHLPPIPVAGAIGFSLIVGMFLMGLRRDEEKSLGQLMLNGFFAPLLTLGIAWIVTFFMVAR